LPLAERVENKAACSRADGSCNGHERADEISKQGDHYPRRILVVGAHSVLRRAKQRPEKYPWLTQLLARRPFKVVAIALAQLDAGRHGLRRRKKGFGKGRVRLRRCVHELQG
jgi:hypothetical protein